MSNPTKRFFLIANYDTNQFEGAFATHAEADRWLNQGYFARVVIKDLSFEDLDCILEGEGTQELWDAV